MRVILGSQLLQAQALPHRLPGVVRYSVIDPFEHTIRRPALTEIGTARTQAWQSDRTGRHTVVASYRSALDSDDSTA